MDTIKTRRDRERFVTLIIAKASEYVNLDVGTVLAYLPGEANEIAIGDMVRVNICGHHVCCKTVFMVPKVEKGDSTWMGLSEALDLEPLKVEQVYRRREVKWHETA